MARYRLAEPFGLWTTIKLKVRMNDDNSILYPQLAIDEKNPIMVFTNSYDNVSDKPLYDMHYALETGIVLTGSVVRFCGEHRMYCNQGDIWFCGMWEPHGHGVTRAPSTVLVMAVWPQLLMDSFFPEAPSIPWMLPFTLPPPERPVMDEGQKKTILNIARRISAVSTDGSMFEECRLRLLLMEMLMCVIEKIPTQYTSDSPSSYRQHEKILPALDLVFSSRTLVTNDTAATACAMSSDCFARLFLKLMGISFSKFALRYRIQRAAHELATTDTPIKAVAANWGFTDESHLHRLFQKHYGHTPSEYRRRIRKHS